jgi:hypothetical protein
VEIPTRCLKSQVSRVNRSSDIACRTAKAEDRPYKRSAGGGLYLLVNPDGSKYWRVAYRWHGTQRTLALGTYPSVGLSDARIERDAAKRVLASGRDPSQVKREQRRTAKEGAANTFEAVARDWFEHWKGGRVEAYAERVLSRLEADVFPQIGRRPIAELEPPELLDMLRRVEARGVHDTARRLKQYVSMIFRYGIATSRRKRDPSTDLRGALKATGMSQRHKSLPRQDMSGFLRLARSL